MRRGMRRGGVIGRGGRVDERERRNQRRKEGDMDETGKSVEIITSEREIGSATVPPHTTHPIQTTNTLTLHPSLSIFGTNKTLRKPLKVVRTIGDPKNSLRAIQDHQGPWETIISHLGPSAILARVYIT